MKTIEANYQFVIRMSLDDVLKLGSASAERAWYVWESQQILKKYGINLLDDMSAAIAKARAGEKLHNLAWAINGNFTLKNGKQWYKYGIHSREYARAVYNGLKKIVDEGLRDGDTAEQIAAAIQKQLDDWAHCVREGWALLVLSGTTTYETGFNCSIDRMSADSRRLCTKTGATDVQGLC